MKNRPSKHIAYNAVTATTTTTTSTAAACADIEGNRGSGPPQKPQKYRFFLAILVRIPCKTTKVTSQHSVLAGR